MRKSSLTLVLAVLVAGVGVLAQSHSNMTEKKASDEIRLSSDLLVGTHLLKAGHYQVACNRETIKFSRIEVGPGIFTTMTKVLEVPCQGTDLGTARPRTELAMVPNKEGVKVLEKLILRGSSIEHVFHD
jgi:hypothetical protein